MEISNELKANLLNDKNDSENPITDAKGLNKVNKVKIKRSNSKTKVATIFKTLLSNIAFVTAVILYSSIGAFVFQILEQHEEIRLCEEGRVKFEKELKTFRENLVNFVTYNLTDEEYQEAIFDSNSTLYSYNPTRYLFLNATDEKKVDSFLIFDKLLNDFKGVVLDVQSTTHYAGQNCIEDSRWAFYSALLFTISIMSSVGYGNVSPLTWEGKLVTICYATIGIPIFGICLINLSSSLGSVFKFVYTQINSINPMQKYLKYYRKQRRERIMKKKLKKKLKQLQATQSYSDLGSSSAIEELQVELKDDKNETNSNNKDLQILSISYDSSDSESESNENNESDNPNESNEVPMSVTILFFVFYITTGAVVFMNFEDWSFVQSVYFVYVTLSTMGFGDFIPGTKITKGQNAKLLTVCLYSFLGMAIMGMCYNVMQSKAKQSILKLVKNFKSFFTCNSNSKKNEDDGEDLDEERQANVEISNNLKELHRFDSSLRRKKIKPTEIE